MPPAHPCLPRARQGPLRVHPMEWAGQSVADKLSGLRQQMAEAGAGALLVTMLGALRLGQARWGAREWHLWRLHGRLARLPARAALSP